MLVAWAIHSPVNRSDLFDSSQLLIVVDVLQFDKLHKQIH